MRVLVNALSALSLSGQHVLFGHLTQLAGWTAGRHELIVLHHESQAQSVRSVLNCPNVSFLPAPRTAAHWMTRSLWEAASLPRIMVRQSIDRYFTPAGTILPACRIPQISLAQNPWCLVPQLHQTFGDKAKAMIQRAAYRKAALQADLMVYNSRHIESLYLGNLRHASAAPTIIAYQGIQDETHEAGRKARFDNNRDPLKILAVSAMARWKGADTLVLALGLLRQRGLPATLTLVGPWPDPTYEADVRRIIAEQKLSETVTITGKVSTEELYQQYAGAKVFCLLSHCESFGIPAVEAQAFGLPVVGSNNCAMPEIGGDGGRFVTPGRPEEAADAIHELLTDEVLWSETSSRAVRNSERFRWDSCSRPLLRMFDL